MVPRCSRCFLVATWAMAHYEYVVRPSYMLQLERDDGGPHGFGEARLRVQLGSLGRVG
jgi:hypothetical protein